MASRREFLNKAGVFGLSSALFPSWMPKLAFRTDPEGDRKRNALITVPGDVLVVIFQRGGMDGLNVVIPFGEGSSYYDKRPTLAIPEPNGTDESVIDLNGFFGLHPSLRPLKDVFDAGQLAVIHAAGSPDPSRSHFDAMEYMERGIPGDKLTGTGWICRHLKTTAWQNDSAFRAIGMGAMLPGSLRGQMSALALKSIADFHLAGRDDQIAAIQQTLASLYGIQAPDNPLSTQAANVFSTFEALTKLSAADYQPANGASYPDGEFGMGLKQVAQLIKAGVGLEVACVDIGGWDTHEEQGDLYGAFPSLLSELAQGIAAFNSDLGDLMGGVTLVTMSEFGRRLEENASRGTDHGHGNCMFVMGGGVNGGVYANWPGLKAENLDDGDLAITMDYRDVLSEIVTGRLMNTAIDQIFPGYTPTLPGITKSR